MGDRGQWRGRRWDADEGQCAGEPGFDRAQVSGVSANWASRAAQSARSATYGAGRARTPAARRTGTERGRSSAQRRSPLPAARRFRATGAGDPAHRTADWVGRQSARARAAPPLDGLERTASAPEHPITRQQQPTQHVQDHPPSTVRRKRPVRRRWPEQTVSYPSIEQHRLISSDSPDSNLTSAAHRRSSPVPIGPGARPACASIRAWSAAAASTRPC